jgi:hypothetical protein
MKIVAQAAIQTDSLRTALVHPNSIHLLAVALIDIIVLFEDRPKLLLLNVINFHRVRCIQVANRFFIDEELSTPCHCPLWQCYFVCCFDVPQDNIPALSQVERLSCDCVGHVKKLSVTGLPLFNYLCNFYSKKQCIFRNALYEGTTKNEVFSAVVSKLFLQLL